MKKRMLSILLCLCMVLMLCPVTAFADVPPNIQKGDINLDGVVTTHDAIILQEYLEGLDGLTYLTADELITVADFNGDGKVDYSDLTELQSCLELRESSITVTNGKATACGTEISGAASYTWVTLTADSPSDNMVFDKWIVNEGGVTLADANSATTTFTMPAHPVSVTATYKLLSASETGSLAITVDGFQVGNTPEDITLSFASTNLGVTFGKDDVKNAVWEQYNDEFDQWDPIFTEAFQADKRYQLALELDRKGLSAPPAVTINGKTPEYCEFGDGGRRIAIECEFGTSPAPAPTITINGPDVICAEENYYFTATAPEGVTFDELFGLGYGIGDYCSLTLGQEADGTAWGVVQTYYYSAGSFELKVSGTTEDNTPVSATKTVQVSKEHIYVDGVCGCGAVQPTLAVTIDGFEVGKTPNDCTFSFDSTIPGVTFDEEDIEYVEWMRFGFDGSFYQWQHISPTTAFQADTAYRFVLWLDNNGLDKLPAITLNGNPVEDCLLEIKNGEPVGIEMECELGTPPERSQYTITYEGGEGVEGSIPAGVKARGEAFTLSSDTFTWDGFVQTGWIDESGAIYDLGGDYMLDEDMTFYPYWEKLITLTVPYTTTVALGDVGEPGETTFELALVDYWGDSLAGGNVTVTAAVTTDGAGDYDGALTITGPEETLWVMLSEGAFAYQVDAGEAGWTVDDTVWGLLMEQIPVAYAMSDDAVASEYTVRILPASCKGTGEYDLDWNATPLERMSFTNTYTKSATEPTNPVNPTGSNPNTGALDDVPKTGDNSNMILWIVLLLASGLGVTGAVVYSKRKKYAK